MNLRIAAGVAALLVCASAAGVEIQSPGRGGNPVEPISNGVAMNMARDEVKQRFGEPGRRAGFPSCVMHFPDFTAETCGQDKRVSRLYLSGPGVTLSGGLRVGSSRADVASVFGNAFGGETGPYRVGVAYSGDRVSSIKIDYQATAEGGEANRAHDAGRSDPGGAVAPGLIGTYRGINGTAGVLELHGNGNYSYQGRPMGHWQAAGDGVSFTGQVFAYAGNHAALQSGGTVLMFRLGAAGQWYAKVK